MPLSFAASFASSFMLCIVAFETARGTLLLRTSQVLPSFPVSRNSFALSPFDKQPVTSRTSALSFPNPNVQNARITHKSHLIFIFLLSRVSLYVHSDGRSMECAVRTG